MPDFRLLEDGKKVDEYVFKGKDFVTFWVRAEGPDGVQEFRLDQIPTTAPPCKGDVLTGDLTTTKRGELKLKKAYGSGNSGGGGGYKRDPKESAAISRMHAQEMSLRALSLRPSELEGLSWDQVRGAIKAWTDWFVKDSEGKTEFAEKQSDVPWDDERPRVAA